METITWVGFSQALFAALLMATKAERSVADKILTGWLALLAIEFLTSGIDYRVYGMPLLSSTFLLFNPAFFLYIKSLTNSRFTLRWMHLLHLAPFLLFELAAYTLREPYSLRDFFDTNNTLWFRYAFSGASMLSCLIYNSISTRMVHLHRVGLKDEFSTIERYKKLSWLMFVIVLYNIYCIVAVMIGILVILFNRHFDIQFQYNYSALLATVFILGFYGVRQRVIYRKIYPSLENAEPKAFKQGLASEKKRTIRQMLLRHFQEEKPYLNPDLSMQMLSDALGIPKHQITEVLNSDIGKHFYQFVNEYRVEEVKQMLRRKDHPWSIDAIGYECGFNSKSTFYAVFKQITGMTPMGFRAQN
jgi:AraC-like DNA-binding protein